MSEKVIEKMSPEFVSELEHMPNLRSQFPHTFASGGAISGMSINCASCGRVISDEHIHGTIESIAGGESVSIKAFAICYYDQIINPFEAKYDQTGTALVKNANGSWSETRWIEEEQEARSVKWFIAQNWQRVLPPAIAAVIVTAWMIGHT